MYQAGTHHLTGLGWLAAIGVFGVIAAVWELLKKAFTGGAPPRPKEPATDFSPFLKELVTGQAQTAYTWRVNATTPLGDRVRLGRCCNRGHTSPAQARAHAGQIQDRIERTGR